MDTRRAKGLVGQIVLAEWLDSSRSDGWTRETPETADDLRCFSAGRLISAASGAVTIAGHWTNEANPQRSGEMTIPSRALVSLRALR
ncbi:hypothetical protein C7E17_00175 [Stenotrophomonas maltophilia]|nr:hypothetical protein C7E17_00175 [Stenotrophomonas maltophilia]